MAEPLLSSLAMLTEFFSAAQIEAAARRTGFVQRASQITGKLFLALVTFGSWSTAKTSLAQLAAKAAQLPKPVEVSPEALHQRMTRRALAAVGRKPGRKFNSCGSIRAVRLLTSRSPRGTSRTTTISTPW